MSGCCACSDSIPANGDGSSTHSHRRHALLGRRLCEDAQLPYAKVGMPYPKVGMPYPNLGMLYPNVGMLYPLAEMPCEGDEPIHQELR